MKLVISHRGNTIGPNSARYGENHPQSIAYACSLGYKCEFDVRYLDGQFWLGHNEPQYQVDVDFFDDEAYFNSDRYYVHCKNIEALFQLKDKKNIHAFYHTNEDVVLMTNSNLLWSYPRKDVLLTEHSIAVLPEIVKEWQGLDKVMGVCSDYPLEYDVEK